MREGFYCRHKGKDSQRQIKYRIEHDQQNTLGQQRRESVCGKAREEGKREGQEGEKI